MENNLNLLRDAMRVDFENRVNLLRQNFNDLITEWDDFNESLIFIYLNFKHSYLKEWLNAGGSRGDFEEYVEDLFNDIPNVLL